ncbi:MAG: response regulator [Deltaproteobacteria bacterium]|nr:MAG: response regulator [Deltaproteobacteria bacterium]
MAEKVLVVDDEQEIRNLLETILTGDGYEVIKASDGAEAIEFAERENPDLILMDITMPGMDGIEACKRLKGADNTRLIPIIIVTGYADNKMQALEVGADDFVNKPFDMVELSFRVKSVLRIRHLTAELDRAVAYIEELQKNLPKL